VEARGQKFWRHWGIVLTGKSVREKNIIAKVTRLPTTAADSTLSIKKMRLEEPVLGEERVFVSPESGDSLG